MERRKIVSGIVVASALTLAAAQAARADTATITISGSTLFESFFLSPSSTNDYVDVNNNGISGFNAAGTPYVEQLAPVTTFTGNGSTVSYQASSGTITRTPAENVIYLETGSVSGLQELLNTQSGLANPWLPLATNVTKGFVNTTSIVSGGVAQYSNSNASSGIPNAIPSAGVDIAVSDVPSKWGLQVAGVSAWNAKPTQAGYGTNVVVSNTGYSNQLVNRTTNGITYNNNTSSPDANTLFDTPVAVAPINIVANPGVGTDQIKATQLQQLFVTGRMPNGENLVAATRSVGSGTRNGAMNSLGIDPSFATGENIGSDATGAAITSLGAHYQPGNYNGSGDLESGVANSRLAIGYDGSDRSTSKNGIAWGSMKVMNDQLGGTQYVTPSVTSIVNNSNVNTGWRIGGLETFITVGDPNATAINAANPALGADGINPVSSSNPVNPAMASAAAAAYLRNITASIKGYNGAPTSDSNLFMPADYLSAGFILQSGTQFVQSPTDATAWSANPNFNQGVHDQALANGTFNAKLVSDASIGAGVAPLRAPSAIPYSDGSTPGAYTYYDSNGVAYTLNGNAALNLRNKIDGDFNNTGIRDINQIPQLMAAVANPVAWAKANNSGSAGAGLGNAAIPEILGDFNGDGNFDAADVRYYADGLALVGTPGSQTLDRKQGFTAVDNNWTASTPNHPAGNYFNTAIATGKPYVAGDSRGDIAGSAAGATPGASPVGADGVINAKDIDYEMAQIRKATGQSSIVPTNGTDPSLDVNGAFGTILTRATSNPNIDVRADLSADMNGDLKINADDLNDLVLNILGTHFGDANLDGVVNFSDFVALSNHFGDTGVGWEGGDFNGDGIVNFSDFVILSNNFGATLTQTEAVEMHDFAVANVPEPTSLGLLGLGGLMLVKRRRRPC